MLRFILTFILSSYHLIITKQTQSFLMSQQLQFQQGSLQTSSRTWSIIRYRCWKNSCFLVLLQKWPNSFCHLLKPNQTKIKKWITAPMSGLELPNPRLTTFKIIYVVLWGKLIPHSTVSFLQTQYCKSIATLLFP